MWVFEYILENSSLQISERASAAIGSTLRWQTVVLVSSHKLAVLVWYIEITHSWINFLFLVCKGSFPIQQKFQAEPLLEAW